MTDSSSEVTRELQPEIREALMRDQAELQREVVLWQRWVRYLALVLAATAVIFTSDPSDLAVLPLLAVAVGYVACVFLTGWAVERAPSRTSRPWLPLLLVTADLVAMGATIYLTSAPIVSNRFLILALLSVPLAAFYFGTGAGVYATALAGLIYVAIASMLPPFVAGPPPISITASLALFAIASGVLTYAFGRFRARMNQLHLFCKIIEEGDLTGGMEPARSPLPNACGDGWMTLRLARRAAR